MSHSLQPGLEFTHCYTVPANKTVPGLYPEASEFKIMPEVFATGFMVGLMEWTCILAIKPYLDWPNEQSVGIKIDVNHIAATPPGFEVTVKVKLVEVEGKKLSFTIEAHDDMDLISKGTHERFIIDKEKFDERLAQKISAKS